MKSLQVVVEGARHLQGTVKVPLSEVPNLQTLLMIHSGLHTALTHMPMTPKGIQWLRKKKSGLYQPNGVDPSNSLTFYFIKSIFDVLLQMLLEVQHVIASQ